jgi:hypothetical protein
MLLKRKSVLYPVLLSSVFILSACVKDKDETGLESTDNSEQGTLLQSAANDDSNCIEGAKTLTTSDGRVLCVVLTAYKAEAPFESGFMAPGKTTHTVFVSDTDGNPIDVSSDDVVTSISQYPMMFMNAGHKHSAPYKSADVSTAEQGNYDFDVYYPMPSAMMDGTSLGTWEYRVKISDNNGTVDDTTDDQIHTVTFEPTVEMYMSSKAFRAVGRNENDKFKNAMGMMPSRQYSVWLESVGKVSEGTAKVKVYLTTQDMDHSLMDMDMDMDMEHSSMSMEKTAARHEGHEMTSENDMDSEHTMSNTDSQTYPAIYAPMAMMGHTMTAMLHSEDGTTEIAIDSVNVEVSTDNGNSWSMLMAGMTHEDMGYYSASVPMSEGDVTMLVKVTVNGNVMTKTGVIADGVGANAIPTLKFSVTE